MVGPRGAPYRMVIASYWDVSQKSPVGLPVMKASPVHKMTDIVSKIQAHVQSRLRTMCKVRGAKATLGTDVSDSG